LIGEVIKEYLVSLGVKIDQPGFDRMKSTLNQASGVVSSATNGWAKDFIKAGAIIGTALAGVSTAIAGVVVSAAKQDLAMEKMANNMLVGKSAAMEMKMALDALGESISDIQAIPELMGRYRALTADGRQMKVGGDYSAQMKDLRDLMFEFTRLKQEASYALQWVGYYLKKHLSQPLAQAKKTFKSINDSIIKNMPVWTEKVARVLTHVINIGMSFIRLLKNIGKALWDVWDSFPRGAKIAIAALSGLFLFINASPLGRAVSLLGMLLLLTEDYFGYMDGKNAALGPVWDKLNLWLTDMKVEAKDFSKTVKEVWRELKILWAEFEKGKGYTLTLQLLNDTWEFMVELVSALGGLLGGAFGEIGKAVKKNGVLDNFSETAYDIGDALDYVLRTLTDVMRQLNLLSSDSKYKGFWSWFGDELSRQLTRLSNFASILAKLVKLVLAVNQFKFKEAGEISQSILGNLGDIVGSYFDGGKAEASGASYKNGVTEGLTEREQAAEAWIQEAAAMNNIDPNLLRALIKQESSFNPNAVSPVGAIGYAQLMPETAKELKVKIEDPRDNIMGGAKYLRQMLDKFDQNEILALAGYNAGPDRARKALREGWKETVGHGENILKYRNEFASRTRYYAEPSSEQQQPHEPEPPKGKSTVEKIGEAAIEAGKTVIDFADEVGRKVLDIVTPIHAALETGFANVDPLLIQGITGRSRFEYAFNPGGNSTNPAYDVQVNVGDIVVAQPNASPQEIGQAVSSGINNSLQDRANYLTISRVVGSKIT